VLSIIQALLKKFMADSRGFTLVEAVIALSILSLGVGLIGTTVFQVLAVQRFWQDDMIANKDTRHAASWFAEDALKATGTDLVDGNPAVNSVTLTLDSGNITYSLDGSDLVREVGAGGDRNVVAEDVASVGFALSGEVLTLTLEVAASRGGTETLTLQNYLRLLGS
jgi:prepilin-type N-terminal cleavage/methylation domain-containing protein